MIEGLKLSDGPVANFPEGQITQKIFVTLLEKISKKNIRNLKNLKKNLKLSKNLNVLEI